MKIATCKLASATPYSPSRLHGIPKPDKLSHDQHEQNTWREKCHSDESGNVFIPPMSFKRALEEAAAFRGDKIKGKGQATWTKHFLAGILPPDPLFVGINKSEIPGETFPCHADGKKSCGTRVMRTFPVVRKWSGVVTFTVLDDTITEEIFAKTLREAGQFIGLGRFRPRNGGFYGRFIVESIEWQEIE